MKKVILILGVLWSIPWNSFGRHIIGGSITYECLGGGDYEFTLTLYRDCNCTNCAELDPVASIGIYKCPEGNCSGMTQSSYLHRLSITLDEIKAVGAPSYPCLIPPNVCTQQGVYKFKLSEYGVNLPLSDDSYHISYQRCCRNVTINNIIRPQDMGATYTIEITPE